MNAEQLSFLRGFLRKKNNKKEVESKEREEKEVKPNNFWAGINICASDMWELKNLTDHVITLPRLSVE